MYNNNKSIDKLYIWNVVTKVTHKHTILIQKTDFVWCSVNYV